MMWVDKYGFEIFQPSPDTLSDGDHEIPDDETVQKKPAEEKQEDKSQNLPLF